MEWLTNWDDLVHGTAVFGAAIPFFLTLAICWKVPARFWWAVAALAIVPVAVWLFKLPNFPPAGSDDVVGGVLVAAVVILALEVWIPKAFSWPPRPTSRCST